MKKKSICIALSLVLFGSQPTFSHTPPDEIPNFDNFSEWVDDWENFQSLYADQELDIIDVHLHPGSYDKLGPKGKEFVKSVFPLDLPDSLKEPLLRFFHLSNLIPMALLLV